MTPPSYETAPGRRYPVLYFLHDGYGDARTLDRRGVAAAALARMRAGSLPEFLIVAPEGRGSWFSDYHDGSRRYERLLATDLPRWVEARYRVLTGQKARGVTGISMGGYGAFKTALLHPDLYGSVSSLSGALIPFGWESLGRYSFVARYTLKRVFGGSERDNALDENDVWNVLWGVCFETPPFEAQLRGGTDDIYGLDGVAAQFAMLLNARGVPATAVLQPGGHDWAYWGPTLMEVFDWHAARFEYDAD